MLRRDPTRIELRTEDLNEFDRAKEEYLQSIASLPTNQKKKTVSTVGPPPPTPADRVSTNDGITLAKDPQLDPIQVASQERKGKSTKDRILGE
ncbi:hypothetical protein BGX27_008658 [Mortierella sp. AM989]|nr:hypothetical protein BGX27_008658 [Mortierella sp. AM989]